MPALIPIGASILGGAIQNRGVKKATEAQAAASDKANDTVLTASREAQAFQQKQVDQARADQEPWRVAGGNALTQLSQRTGAGGDLMGQSSAFSSPFQFQSDPGYAFRQAEGMKGLTNSAAARGGLLSGAALKAASRYNQDFASNEYGNAFGRYQTENTNQFSRDQTTQTNQFNRLASLANVGQTAANQNGANAMQLGGAVGNNLMRTAGQVGENQMGVGNARASGYLSNANNLTNTMNAATSAWGQFRSGGM